MSPSSLMLITDDPHQSRVALLEEGRLTEIFLERRRGWSAVGNVYKGRVTRVVPGIQAAFVDIGLERDAFLYVNDVRRGLESLEDDAEEGAAGNGDGAGPEGRGEGGAPAIEEMIAAGQELLVQVLKDPLPNKGARISTQISLPGRFLVLLPTEEHLGLSRRIEDEEERARLRELLEAVRPPAAGLIVRTAGEGKGEEEFVADAAFLVRRWEEIRRRAEAASTPSLIHQDLDLPLRAIRDLLVEETAQVLVEGAETHRRVVDFLEGMGSPLVDRVEPWNDPMPLFERYGVERQIAAALKSRVWLDSGGYLVINPTEALVAIDVNTGRYVGRSNLEETVVRTNLEAVSEVARQIRLRDLAGIIVVDFIDMVEEEHRRQVFDALEQELAKDRARNKALTISDFGLVEITRKRGRTNLYGMLTRPCPHCSGSGRIRATASVCLELRRSALERRRPPDDRALELTAHPDVIHALREEERPILEELEERLGPIRLVADEALHHEHYRLEEA